MKKKRFTLQSMLMGCMVLLLGAGTLSAQVNIERNWTAGTFDTEIGWEIINVTTQDVVDCIAPPNAFGTPATTVLNVPAGTYELRVWDDFGDGWNGAAISITQGATTLISSTGPPAGPLFPPANICNGVPSPLGTGGASAGTFVVGVACNLTCPDDITADTQPGLCGAIVNYGPATTDCPDPVVYDIPSGTEFLAGTTTTVTGTSGASQCTFTVTVGPDEVPPTFDPCPSDIVLTLDPGACSAFVNYTVEAFDNCPAVPQTVAGPLCDPCEDPTGGSALACAPFAQNSIIQFIELPGNGTIDFFCFNQETFGNQPLATINIYGPQATPPSTNGGDTPIGSQMYQTSAADDGSCVCVDFDTPVVIPAGANGVWVEVFTPGVTLNSRVVQTPATCDGNAATGQDTWIEAPACGLTPPGTFASIGFILDASFALGYNPGELVVEQTDDSGFTAGDEFPIGTTIQTWEATDVAGNTSVCEFTVQINEFPNPTASLACNDNVQISLDESGCATVGADDILEGGPYGCYDDYIVEVLNQFGFPNGDQVCCNLVGQTRTVRVTDPETGNMCWGSIVIEDKLKPVIECLDLEVSCTQDLEGTPYIGDVIDNVFVHPHPGVSIGAPPATLETTNAGGNANAVGGQVFFDVTNNTNGDITVIELGMNISAATDVIVKIAPDTYVGKEQNAGAWTQIGVADANTGPFSGAFPGNGTITPAPTDFTIPPGTWGIALETPTAANNYTNGANTYDDGILTIQTGAGQNAPFAGLFSPRTWNGYITYSNLFESEQIDPTDNCDVEYAVPAYTETVVPGNCADGVTETIIRTWTVVDPSGNESSCTQTITRVQPTLADVELPPMYDDQDLPALDCSGNGWDLNGNGYPDINETGQPQITGVPVENNDGCNLTWTFEDVVIDICDGSYKVRREWLIIDWCTGEEAEYNQLIKVTDSTGPDVVCPQGPVTINVYQASAPSGGVHQICEGFVNIPPIQVLGDDCSNLDPGSYVTEVWTNVNGAPGVVLETNQGNGGTFVLDIIADNPPTNQAEYFVRHRIYDSCGNVTDCIYLITLVDKVPPVAICDEITELSITNNGGSGEGCSTLPAENLDDGSYDNCGDVYFYAAKMNAFLTPPYFYQYYPSLEFCCDEIGDNMVILLVLDFDPTLTPGATLPDGSIFLLPGNQIFEGSFNTCMVTVQVTDKIPPVLLSCPQSATITCDEYLDTYAAPLEQDDFSILDVFGEAAFYDNCVFEPDYNVNVNIDACSEGTITRTWTAQDDNGTATCTQTIFVEHVSDWVVEFPADITAECVDGSLPDFGEPEVFFDECELIGTSFEDVYFYIVPDACYKIERYWTVINWCVYDDFGTDVYEEDGFAECNLFVDWDGDGDQDCRTFRDGWNQNGTPGIADGYIDYKQIIKVIDEDDPEFTIPAIDGCIVDTDCDTDITLPYPDITDECSPEFDVDITGDLGTFNNITADVTVSNVGVGTYTITYAVTDNCGNTAYQTFDLDVEDCKKPTPYCQNLVIEIMQTGMVEVWAEDFDAGSFDNCGPVDPSFSMTNPDQDGLMLTCDDLGLNQIEVYFHDIYGNVDFCIVELIVQDNMNACGSVMVSGAIETEGDAPVADVNVEMNGGLFMDVTDLAGEYQFDNLVQGEDYTVTPMLDVDPANGVSTWDLVLISRHILQVENLDSPYKIIAADANKSGEVTTLDMVYIRQVILNMVAGFPNNTSWRFVDADYVFTNPQAPLAENFPEVINYNNISLSDLNADFVAVKVGDVNGSAATNANAGTGNRTFNGSLVLNAQDRTVKAGETFTVDFTAEAADLLGYQFTLNFNNAALELIDIEGEVADADNFGLALVEDGAITTSWNESTARAINGKLFGLTFTAKSDAKLSDLLSISSRYTVAESYSAGNGLQDVELTFNGQVAGAGFELYQNVPNPFEGVTMIGFNLPEATQATLTIMDVSGKVIKTIQSDFAKGYNEVRVSNIDATGVLYYQLATDNHTATKKMIIIE
jgi:hypothetical protein